MTVGNVIFFLHFMYRRRILITKGLHKKTKNSKTQLNVKLYAQTKRDNDREHQYVRHIEIILVLYLPKLELLRELH